MIKWWKSNFLDAELLLTIVLFALIVVWGEFLGGEAMFDRLVETRATDIYDVAVAVYGALLGFVVTANSILLGFAETSDRLALLRKSRHYAQMWRTFSSASIVLGLAAAVSLLGIVISGSECLERWIFYVWAGLSILVALRIARTLWILQRMVELFTKQTEAVKPAAAAKPVDTANRNADD